MQSVSLRIKVYPQFPLFSWRLKFILIFSCISSLGRGASLLFPYIDTFVQLDPVTTFFRPMKGYVSGIKKLCQICVHTNHRPTELA